VSGQYGIRSIPTLIVFHQGKEIDRLAGALPAAQLQQWIRQALLKAIQ
jgi:thioredoxin 2